MSDVKVGLQLIVYGERQMREPAQTLREVAQAGYAGVEGGHDFASLLLEQQALGLLSDNGLAWAGTHGGYGDIADPDDVARALDSLAQVGGKYLICSGVPDTESLEGYRQAAAVFNRVGEQCREAGVTFCYHNHAFEFKELGGEKGIHYLGANTDPELVKFNIDVYWVTVGGEDPAQFIARYADRAGFYHFKDGAPGSFVELGQGTVDLPSALQAARQAGVDWIICEQDTTELDPAESIRISREYLRGLGV